MLKKVVTSISVLVFLDDIKPFYVEANSSDFATGAGLSQQLESDSKWHLVAFFSKSFVTIDIFRIQ